MSIVDHNQSIQVSYSLEDTFNALKNACQKLDEFTVDKFDETLKIIYLKAGVSWVSWGENITVTVNSSKNGGSEVSVLSTPKTGVLFGGATDMGKNRKNINTIMSALSEELKSYSIKTEEDITIESVANDIKKLFELKEKGILTEEEFNEKRKKLLSNM